MNEKNPNLEFNTNSINLNIYDRISISNIEILAQPIVSKNPNIHFEILSRFYDKSNNLIMPDIIYSSSQDHHSLFKIDLEILKKTFEEINYYFKDKNYLHKIAINLSESSIKYNDCYLGYFSELIEKYKFNAELFNLEITERKTNNLENFIENAVKNNLNISIDDFGTGDFTQEKLRDDVIPIFKYYNKLNKLSLKVDKSIIEKLDQEYHEKIIDSAYLDFIFSIKKTYPELNLIIEGVEKKEIIKYLNIKAKSQKINIDYFQGFYFSKPKKLNSNYKQIIYNPKEFE